MLLKVSQLQQVQPVNEPSIKSTTENNWADQEEYKPFVSVVVPAYNEALILEQNLDILSQYMESLEDEYCWEIIVVNDGSKDETGSLAEAFASSRKNIRVFHHVINCGLSQALQSGFKHCQGDYIVTMDLDLSYSPVHIRNLLTKIRATQAEIVVASPYMQEGKVSNVPWLRKTLSIWANRFLSVATKGNLATLTGMVRVYDAKFLRTLNLRSTGMDINSEVINKALILHARIEEIPGHLSWIPQKTKGVKRSSSMKIFWHTYSVIISGFLFRPVIFFVIPGFVLFLLSLYANAWVLIHVFTNYQKLAQSAQFFDPTEAVAAAFYQAPHTFIIGGMTLMLSIQLLSLGSLSMQSKAYFQELFHQGTNIYRSTRED